MEYRKRIIVGSRQSPLAKAQVNIFLKSLKIFFGAKYFNKLEHNVNVFM